MQPEGHHPAELDIGRPTAPVDDPRGAECMGDLDRIDGPGRRMPGSARLVEGTCTTGNDIGDDPQAVANPSVWVHKQFYTRRREWFEVRAGITFVMWRAPAGRAATHKRAQGEGDHAVGWSDPGNAPLWRDNICSPVAAG